MFAEEPSAIIRTYILPLKHYKGMYLGNDYSVDSLKRSSGEQLFPSVLQIRRIPVPRQSEITVKSHVSSNVTDNKTIKCYEPPIGKHRTTVHGAGPLLSKWGHRAMVIVKCKSINQRAFIM